MDDVHDPMLRHLCDVINTYVWLRTDRVDQLKYAQMGLRTLYRLVATSLREVTKDDWRPEHVVALTDQELVGYFHGTSVPSFKESIRRTDVGYVYLFEDGKADVITDERGMRHICDQVTSVDSVKELRGVVAQSGNVRGRVRIVWSKSDLAKVLQGEILVAPSTMPDYVSVMRIASAIVTNEGGITFHAASVSRELNKPCIVGTKNATKVLKDGDEVEVDADSGIVKIVKRAN